jgi:hypothetical protein
LQIFHSRRQSLQRLGVLILGLARRIVGDLNLILDLLLRRNLRARQRPTQNFT